ncbi:DDE-type integrase/transposase/recombinase [Acinetobacter baumannii]|uniref:DDE-type integrase/transposase/recombinase n=1 Tax=Acinetobacter baumannii TaxID=470 RepID=UPI001CDC7A56|nr:DDE-type integrase/transposase/recombinase [Acinetobacter baumannii]MCA4394998.1 DDE-type integrase/transposase/recombinase [Acinetobacter baumannii]MDM8398954.1 DDE-type integrase/transposase/recombinase [Acinetobacter baumannii]MDM8403434.1 DDE-type integrase/transposase/recombinase [Acinetobacter baumannii]MDM8407356.1 DDE-type integrase/transposase/recombinase [Acinetobacter baumannii]MDM8411241.1 DDE-type integrase/transposase/recombinase [Acinetobacter baumannii]
MTTPDLAIQDYLREVAANLQAAGHGQKGEIIATACKYLDVSRPQLYRDLETVGFKSERKQRSDKGKTVVPTEVAEMIGGMVHVATRANGKKTLPITTALDMLVADGKAPKVSAATVARVMKQNMCHPKQLATPSAHTQQKSLHPNHVWQVDASVCVLFYLPKGGMQVMDEKKFYKNKPANVKKIENDRVIRYVMTDHYSGSIYVEYVYGSESSENLIEIFLNAIQKRSAQEPMHGVPNILYTDKGCANTSGLFRNLLERLDVTFIPHATGNSQAKGQVENAQNIVETQFEGRLRFMQINNIQELNAQATAWRMYWNETKIHSRTKRSRNAVWQTIKPEQLRIAPTMELCRELISTVPVEKTVKANLTVSHAIQGYGSQDYDVRHVDGVYPKAKLQIVVNPYRAPCIDVLTKDQHGNEVIFTCEPMQVDWVGFGNDAAIIGEEIKAMPQSKIDENRKRILKKAYDAETLEQVDKAIAKKKPAYDGQLNAMADVAAVEVPTYIKRAGEQVTTPIQRRESAPISTVEAAKEIRGLIGDLWTTDHYKALKKSYPDGLVPADAVREIAEAIKAEQELPLQRPQLRVVG